MASLFKTMSQMFKQARQNVVELFTGPSREVILDKSGREITTINSFQLPNNPIPIIAQLTLKDWIFFICGYFAFFVDMLDFYLLAIQTTKLAKYFHTDKATITSAITYGMLLRWTGAVIFGLFGDYFGRKRPMVVNLILLGALQVSTIYSTNLASFLATRALFGSFMGGIWGCAAATAMESLPIESRGIFSGIYESGASSGYIAAAILNLIVGDSPASWKTTFWISAGLSWFGALFRLCLPESKQFLDAKRKASEETGNSSQPRRKRASVFLRQFGAMILQEWRTIFYMIILVSLSGYLAHASVDSYTTFLIDSKGMSSNKASKGSIIMKSGGIAGAPIIGYISQTVGRRRSFVFCGIMICLLIPWWVIPDNPATLAAGGFFFIFFVQGLTGILPIHLNELAPPKFRALIAGCSFQLGVMVSAPSVQLVNSIAEKHFVTSRQTGKLVEAYGPVMAGFAAICGLLLIFWAAIGPERRGSHFEVVAPAGIEEEKLSVDLSGGIQLVPSREHQYQDDHFKKEDVEKI